tara:strand:+ start:52 stop:279 length:228 start_codon:yes stop_codon:yes gene_type:complete
MAYTDEQAKKDIFAAMDSVSIVEKIKAIDESKRTEDENNELFRNERHVKIKMGLRKFVENLTQAQNKKITDLNLD